MYEYDESNAVLIDTDNENMKKHIGELGHLYVGERCWFEYNKSPGIGMKTTLVAQTYLDESNNILQVRTQNSIYKFQLKK